MTRPDLSHPAWGRYVAATLQGDVMYARGNEDYCRQYWLDGMAHLDDALLSGRYAGGENGCVNDADFFECLNRIGVGRGPY